MQINSTIKTFETNLKLDLMSYLRNYFCDYDNASITALISFKLDETYEDSFIKINLTNDIKHDSSFSNHTMNSSSSNFIDIKENFLPSHKSDSDFDDQETEYQRSNDDHHDNVDIKPLEETSLNEIKNIFLSSSYNNCNNNKTTVSKNSRRKSKRPQRKLVEPIINESNNMNTIVPISRAKIARLTDSSNISSHNNNINSSNNNNIYTNINLSNGNSICNIKKEIELAPEIESKDRHSNETTTTNNSIIISNDHKILPSILALNGISTDSNILTSALMSSSNSFTILSPNTYNLLRSVGSLTVSAAPNSIPLLNTCVSIANPSLSSTNHSNTSPVTTSTCITNVPIAVSPKKAHKTIAISSAQPILSSINNDNITNNNAKISIKTSTANFNNNNNNNSSNTLRTISTINSSRQSVPSQVLSNSTSKLYKCRFCPKTFNRKFCRERHERLHTGIKPYSCEICNDKFIRLEDKKRHVRSNHNGRCENLLSESNNASETNSQPS